MPPPKPKVKRERNIYGDFVVTKINIKEREIPVPQKDEEEEEEEEESSEEEEEQAPAQEEAEEEVKKGKSSGDFGRDILASLSLLAFGII